MNCEQGELEKHSLLGQTEDGLAYHVPRRANNRRLSQLGKALRWTCHFVLCGLLIANVVLMGRKLSGHQAVHRVNAIDGATVTYTTARYGRNVEYMSLDHEFDHWWQSEESGHSGVIRLNPDDIHALPVWGAIGMFHQLHCLTGIRKALQRAKAGEDIGTDDHDDPHWPHCFWYLRQSILCAADDTIEMSHGWDSEIQPNGTVVSIRVGSIDGGTDLRSCRNSDTLYKLRAERGMVAELARIQFMRKKALGELNATDDTSM
ncbi:uncharacterized protein Z520_07537 [Fonsecaea multimorphosa CBS 102226]|uniref:Uncharacterized protein n=1 Tax=Fonsecaea multimorphosa CBS 102226 TaxID=1442371 RepID=A0A0D2JTJ2_9EURO|nr:uncharacterized protein Z520_07537 [Fonsecaea multimorphosa CBS 102226]KIX96817.1 hypothetical protein Z520_07537 [Fonsecaea multimorphosa CBS 102226]OAL22497.1 hypothetical protein AYO22_07055 [Fonsecaea multimorphosa]